MTADVTSDERADRWLRWAATFFVLAVLFHNSDHLRRGSDTLSTDVFVAGSLAMIVEVGVVVLVFMRHRWAAIASVATGFPLAAGYVFVTVDDCWSAATRDASGNLQASATAFPGGMQALLYFVDDILSKYGTDPTATYLLDHRILYIVPVVNPDGYKINEDYYFSTGGVAFGYHRKNARDTNGHAKPGPFRASAAREVRTPHPPPSSDGRHVSEALM